MSDMVLVANKPRAREAEVGDPGAHWTASLGESASFSLRERLCCQNKGKGD